MASHITTTTSIREHLAPLLLYELRRTPLGRRTLVERTGFTESIVRTELEKLEAQGLVAFRKAGTALTERGQRWLATRWKWLIALGEVRLLTLILDRVSYAAQVRGLDSEIRSWLYRDQAIRVGATATLFFLQRSEGLSLLDETTILKKRSPADAQALETLFPKPRVGDLLIVVFGPDRGRALQGLWAVLCALLEKT